MPPQNQQSSLKIGDTTFKSFTIVPTEKLDKKWAEVKDRPAPTSEQIEKLAMLDDRLAIAKSYKQKKHDIWNFSYLQYRSVNHITGLYGGWPSFWNIWGTGVFIPRTFETIESIKVQMMGRKPDFTVKPTLPITQTDADNMNRLTHSEWDRSDTQTEVAETVHDALVYGSGIVRTDMLNKKKQEMTLKWKKDEKGGIYVDYESELVQKYYGVGSRRVDPYDLYPNPSPEAYKMDNVGWCFERNVTDAWDLRQEYQVLADSGAKGVTDEWQYIKPGGDINDYKYLRNEIDSLYNKTDNRYPGNISEMVSGATLRPTNTNAKGKIEVWEYWEDDRYIVMTGTGLILRDSPNPYPHKKIPYVKFGVIDCNEFFPMGIPEYMRWLQIAENVLYDEGLSNVIMSVHKMFAINSRYLEDEGELVVRPHGTIHLKQIPNVKLSDAIMPIEYTQQMGNYFEFMRLNTQNIQTVTGVSPYQTGGVTKESKVERATVANRLAFAGSARIEEISRHINDSLVKGIVDHYVANIQFYYQNADAFSTDGLPIETKSAGKSYYIKYIAKSSGDITQEDLDQAKQDGYVGVISQDQIQGRYKVVTEGGSKMPLDPDTRAQLTLKFFEMSQGAMQPSEGEPVLNPKTGQMQQVMVPIFDLKRIAEEVAKDMFEISDPQDYLYQEKKPEMTPSIPTDLAGSGAGIIPNPAEQPANIISNNQ